MTTPLTTFLANEMDARRWTQRDIAEAAGFKSHVGIGNILRGKTKMPELKTLAALAGALATETASAAVYFSRLVYAAGYSIEEERADEVLARLGAVLSEEQRQRLGRMSPEQFVRAVNLILDLIDGGAPPRQE